MTTWGGELLALPGAASRPSSQPEAPNPARSYNQVQRWLRSGRYSSAACRSGRSPGRGPDDDQDRDRQPAGDDGADPDGRRRGRDLVRVAVPREGRRGSEDHRQDSPIPVIADIHFNHTRLRSRRSTRPTASASTRATSVAARVAEVAVKATEAGVPMRIGVNSGSLPKHLHDLEREPPSRRWSPPRSSSSSWSRSSSRTSRSRSSPRTSQHDRGQPAARREEDPVSDPPRDHRGTRSGRAR